MLRQSGEPLFPGLDGPPDSSCRPSRFVFASQLKTLFLQGLQLPPAGARTPS